MKLKALFFPCLLAMVACGPSVGPSSDWVGWSDISGPLKPEVNATTATASSLPTPSAGQTLRMVTFNVHLGEDVDGVIQSIQGNASLKTADVIFIQEIQSYSSEGSSRASQVAGALDMAYVYAPARGYERNSESGTHGDAILSRYPLHDIEIMELPRGKLMIDEERRIAVAATLHTAADDLRIITTHLDTRLNASERILQLRPVVLEAPSPVVIGGDFNTNPLTWAFNLIPVLPFSPSGGSDQALVLDDYMRSIQFSTPTASSGSTVSFPGVEARLDSIFVRGVTSSNGVVERDISVSDHWPVWVDVRL